MPRVAIGGFQHETNTFAPIVADFGRFEQADAWPPLSRGQALLDNLTGPMNLPPAGFIGEADKLDFELIPLTWCAAGPSAPVTGHAFETVCEYLLTDLAAALPVDGVYLDLHGAMVTDRFDDGEGELLRRIRELIGSDLPLVVSLDLHANITTAMIEHASLLVSYRTYPHVDMAETGARAARLLHRLITDDLHPAKAWRQLPFLIPLTAQCTLIEPAASLMAKLADLERDSLLSLNFTCGFPPADIADCGPAVFGYGLDAGQLDQTIDRFTDMILAREADFAETLYDSDTAVTLALDAVARDEIPVVLADTQDNPGGGGNSDTVGLLKALIARQAPAVLAVMYDPEVAAEAHRHRIGESFEADLGAKSGFGDEQPYRGRFTVEALGDGTFTGTGPFYLGCRIQLGPMALLRGGEVRIVVASGRQQAADQAIFRHLGVEPADTAILALKSSVHFRADFQPIARHILVVEAPGPNTADPLRLDYHKLRAGMRLRPLGPVFQS